MHWIGSCLYNDSEMCLCEQLVVVRKMPSPAPAHVASDQQKTAPKLSQMKMPFSRSNLRREHLQSSQTGLQHAFHFPCAEFMHLWLILKLLKLVIVLSTYSVNWTKAETKKHCYMQPVIYCTCRLPFVKLDRLVTVPWMHNAIGNKRWHSIQ